MYQIGLESRYHFTNDCKTILDDYSWWISLVKQICKKANNFEIRCWKGEADAIDTGKRFGNPIENSTTNELVFKGRITDEFHKEITTNYLTEDNYLKWFTLIVYRDEIMLFTSEHYGSEIHLLNVSSDEIPSVKSWIEQFSSIEIVYIGEMNDAEEVSENNDGTLNITEDEITEIKDTFLKYFGKDSVNSEALTNRKDRHNDKG